MIDNFTVLTKGGLVLWSHTGFQLNGNPINELIRSILLEDRLSEKKFTYHNEYLLTWVQENEFELIFVAIHSISIQIIFIDTLLETVKQKFVSTFKKTLQEAKGIGKGMPSLSNVEFNFDKEYTKIVDMLEERSREEKQLQKEGLLIKQYKKKEDKKNDDEDESDKKTTFIEKQIMQGEELLQNAANSPKTPTNKYEKKKKDKPSAKPVTPASESDESDEDEHKSSSSQKASNGGMNETVLANIEKMKKRLSKVKNGPKKSSKKVDSPEDTVPVATKTKTKKEATTWDTFDTTYNKKKEGKIDFSRKAENEDDELQRHKDKYLPNPNQQTDIDADLEPESSEEEEEEAAPKKGNIFTSFFSSLTNGRTLTKEDLDPVMEEFKQSLMKKNVAQEIAVSICDSVSEGLVGKKLGTFSSVKSEVTKVLAETLTRILTPTRTINILKEASTAREQGRPYVIVFCGVNGVGKSTTLSKICYWLLQKEFSCLIAACDTFRSGAVEQLQVHARCLGVPVFQKGYGKNAASLAKEAIAHAKKNKYDIVLVDTAGRMQDNEPLMKSLIELIQVNQPDLVLFVGEALVGNDGIDQLQKFNSSLKILAQNENSTKQTKDLIDGIVLTKFDTIDEKVGAAVSMVHKTGHPIVFVGVGQTYTDLRTLKVESVVKALLKN
ncbi:hypothetical protein FDP41_005535 [Naegleria fowleri]|uniref:SRP54-type proteins GTP-binding domain-containing protein n=1 Tax=Naegleria fowleri TaxID=5763 RepID=A0A6A5BMK1_NAEFO|nr:uncharacterized protein FDP41_005535 [Naegleria fowleri]KAF0975541.1 hypothetical protein FDP41_005535 [Naegleria fowleri]CAG4718021.1 unnamed protein product [Naegleria fowleri]